MGTQSESFARVESQSGSELPAIEAGAASWPYATRPTCPPCWEIDLRRMATECGLTEVAIVYGNPGRVVLTPRHFPAWVARKFRRGLLRQCAGHRPEAGQQGD